MTKRKFILFITAAFCFSACPGSANSARDIDGDHLVPVDRTFEQNDLGRAYRVLYERQLLVTPGNVARFIFLPALKGKERTASVYRVGGKKDALPGGYWVTATQSSVSLWDLVKPGAVRRSDSRTVLIRRSDAPLPESTARVIQKVWLAMLTAARPMPSNEVAGESDTIIFSSTNADGTLLRAQAHGFSNNNRAIIELGDGLCQYCDVPAPDRPAVARKIEEAALVLIKQLSPAPDKK